MSVKCLAFDIDGTICYENGRISDALDKYLHELDDMKYVLVSGRSLEDISGFMDNSNLDCPFIIMNGSAAYDKDKLIFKNEIPTVITKRVVAIFRKYDIPFALVQLNNTQCVKGRNCTYEEMVRRKFNDYSDNAFYRSLKDVEFTKLDYAKVMKIEGLVDSDSMKLEIMNELSCIDNIYITSSEGFNIEVMDVNSNKGEGLAKMLEYLNISSDECLVFGDSANDIAMFQMFKESVLVEHDNESLKKYAKYSCDSCKNDGVVKFLCSYFKK